MKYILLICDGMADLPQKKGNYKGKTPLEVAKTPNFDFLAEKGICGLMRPVPEKIYPGSDVAHLSLLGYELKKYYPGRGPLEALGAGIKLEHGDIAFRANIGTVDKNFKVIDRRAGRIRDEKQLKEIEKAVNKIKLPVEFEFIHTIDHRGALVLRGKNLSDKISDTDPHKTNVKVLKAHGSKPIAAIINQFTKKSYEVLKDLEFNKNRELPANCILLRGAGTYKKVPSFSEMHNLRGACIAAMALVRGVAEYTGLDLLEVSGITGDENTNIKGKFETALKAFESYDFVLVNVKAADNFGHDGNFAGKVKAIEKIDSHLNILVESLDNYILTLTADHATPVEKKDHFNTFVPICIAGNGIEAGNVKKYSEKGCAKGDLKKIRGIGLIRILKGIGK